MSPKNLSLSNFGDGCIISAGRDTLKIAALIPADLALRVTSKYPPWMLRTNAVIMSNGCNDFLPRIVHVTVWFDVFNPSFVYGVSPVTDDTRRAGGRRERMILLEYYCTGWKEKLSPWLSYMNSTPSIWWKYLQVKKPAGKLILTSNFKVKFFFCIVFYSLQGKTFPRNHRSQFCSENGKKRACVLTATLWFRTRGCLFYVIFALGFTNVWFIIVVAPVWV